MNKVIEEVNGNRDVLANLNNNKRKKRRVTWADTSPNNTNIQVVPTNNLITMFVGNTFLFLDIGIKASSDSSIYFVATSKENQLVKYASSSSDHT